MSIWFFIDESFYRFFGFDDPNGNFCHGAVGVPVKNYPAFQRQIAPLVQSYYRKFRFLFGHAPAEIKSSDLRRMPRLFQARFTRELSRMLAQQGAFVSGFYTPTEGFIMEQVRVDLLGEADEVPAEHLDLYDAARERLLAAVGGAGQAGLITRLLTLPVAAIKFMLGSFDCNFRIQYDPRQGDEDREVREAVAQYMNLLLNMPDPLRQANNYQGMDINRRSEDELGLQLADVIAGHVREFFRNNPQPLNVGSTPRLITATSDEPLQKFETMDGMLFKAASLHPIPRHLGAV